MIENIGKIRTRISLSIISLSVLFIMVIIYKLLYLYTGKDYVYYVPIFILSIFLIYEIYVRVASSFYIRKITFEEFQQLKNKKLIHYTNHISDEEYLLFLRNSKVKLTGNNSAKSNYVMKFKDKKKYYIWFHLEDDFKKNEPELKSFLFSHSTESSPRKYKVIIDPDNLDSNKLYVRPDNGNIVYFGNLEETATIETTFNWYNKSLYLKELIVPTIRSVFSISTYHLSIHQVIGIIIDIMSSKKGTI